MKCPNCGERGRIDINNHSEGFSKGASPVKECGNCGLIWRIKMVGKYSETDIIRPVMPQTQKNEAKFAENFSVA